MDPCISNPCQLHKGTNGTISIKFNPTAAAEHLTSIVHAYVGGVWFPYKLDNPDACIRSGLECPVKPNINYLYHYTLLVQKIFPSVSVFQFQIIVP